MRTRALRHRVTARAIQRATSPISTISAWLARAEVVAAARAITSSGARTLRTASPGKRAVEADAAVRALNVRASVAFRMVRPIAAHIIATLVRFVIQSQLILPTVLRRGV